MTRRMIVFGIGFIVVGAVVIPWLLETGRMIAGLAAVLVCWLVLGLVGRLRFSKSKVDRSAPRETESAFEPADGVVGIIPIPGVESEPNSIAPAFRRFRSLRDVPSELPQSQGAARSRRELEPLRGRVLLFSLFVGRDGKSWSDDEIARAHQALEKAAGWVEREAVRWKAPVNVDLAEIYFAADDPVREEVLIEASLEQNEGGLFEHAADVKAISSASRAAAVLDFRDVGDLFEQIARRASGDHLVWLLHLRRAGRSIAIVPDDTPWPGVALAVCYAREANFPEPLASPPITSAITVVHEMLHLFGATDKYGGSLGDYPKGSVTRRDVMVDDQRSMNRLRVDPLTAREIGWAR